jgi:hypothetical protein
MVKDKFPLIGLLVIGSALQGCGGPAGPDQTITLPAGWIMEDDPAGDLHYSSWIINDQNSTKVEITSFVAEGAPEEILKKMEVWKEYMGESTQNAQFVTRARTLGHYNSVRFFAFRHPNDTNNGTVSLWLIGKKREFAMTLSSKNLKRVALTDLADKFAEDFSKVN